MSMRGFINKMTQRQISQSASHYSGKVSCDDGKVWEALTAIKSGDKERLTQLIAKNPALTRGKFKGDSLLTIAVLEARNRLCEQDSEDICVILLKSGADANEKSYVDAWYETPLITSIRFNYPEMTRIFLHYGASVTCTNFYCHDAVYQAVVENNYQILHILFSTVPQMELEHEDTNERRCPLQLALGHSHIYYLKKKCFLFLLNYNFDCDCIPSMKLPPNVLVDWMFLAKGILQEEHHLKGEKLSNLVSLKNLARISLRKSMIKAAKSNGTNFYIILEKLELPRIIFDFLLLKDIIFKD